MNKIKCDKSTGVIHSKYTILKDNLSNTFSLLIFLIMNFYKEKLS